MLSHLKSNFIFPLVEKHQERDISSKIRLIKADYIQSWELRKKRRQTQVHKILEISQAKVPYYRDLFKKLDFDPKRVLKDLRYLQELPFLTKEMLQEHEDRLINEDLKKEVLHIRKTGGSTGPATPIYYDQEALDWTSAVNLFALSFTGRKNNDLECFIATSAPLKSNLKDAWREKIKHWVLNRHCIHSYNFDDISMKALWTDLQNRKPFVIHGHPSTLYALSKYIDKTNTFNKHVIKAFESTGENLDKKKIESIQKSIGCKVFNRFGNAEFGVIAHSKDDPNKLEIIDYICYPETVSLGNGLDEIVLTTTTNTAMPLVRYKTGDIGQLTTDGDREYLQKIQGRIHDMVEVDGNTYSTHYIQSVLDQVGGVDEFQIVEKNNGEKLIKIVPNKNTNREGVEKCLVKLFPLGKVEINFTNFEGLILSGWRDKFRYIVKEG